MNIVFHFGERAFGDIEKVEKLSLGAPAMSLRNICCDRYCRSSCLVCQPLLPSRKCFDGSEDEARECISFLPSQQPLEARLPRSIQHFGFSLVAGYWFLVATRAGS